MAASDKILGEKHNSLFQKMLTPLDKPVYASVYSLFETPNGARKDQKTSVVFITTFENISSVYNTKFSPVSHLTVWKVSICGVDSGRYFLAFGLNTERYSVSLRIQSERGKIRTRIKSKFGHFWRSVCQMHRLKICGGFRFLSKVRSICGHLSVSNFPGVLLINYVKDGLIKRNG